MNTAVTDQSPDAAAMEGPGARLKALRVAQELELSRVATLLHLSDEKLEALESDDYARLPGSVFIQGYIRNYARVLGVPAEPLLKAFHAQMPGGGRQPDLKITQVRHEVRSSHLLVRLMTWVIVLGLIGLVVVWWRGYLQWPLQTASDGQASPAGLNSIQAEDAPAGMADELPVLQTLDEQEQALPTPPAAPDQAPPPAAATAVPDAAGTVPVETPPAPAEEKPETAGEKAETAPAPAVAETVVFEFTGTSWSKVRDADGKLLIMGEIGKGTRRVLQGRPPYDVVLGNAAAVTLTVNGQPFDIAPFTRGNVARLRLDPERLKRQ